MTRRLPKRLKLSGAATYAVDGTTVTFYSDRVLRLSDCPDGILRCLPMLATGASRAQLDAAAQFEDSLGEVLHILFRLGFVIEARENSWAGELAEKQVEYWCALGVDGNAVQRRIADAHVGILGVGGIGSVVLEHLVAGGVSSFVLVDHDVVDLTNLNRQFIYARADVGRLKVAVAEEYVRARNPNAAVSLVAQMMSAPKDFFRLDAFDPLDILILAADAPFPLIRPLTIAWCARRRVAFIDASCGVSSGSWGPLLTPERVKAELGASRRFRGSAATPLPPERPMTASFGATNGIVAGYLARDVLHHLAGLPAQSLDRIVTVDFSAGTSSSGPLVTKAASAGGRRRK